jgi:hypothetical protein
MVLLFKYPEVTFSYNSFLDHYTWQLSGCLF